ncbi:MAG: phage tail protein, partial [Opitutaceae bacterium]
MGSSKSSSSSGSSSYDYFGTILIGLGEGPLDALVSIIEDGKEIWHGPLLRNGATQPSLITIADRGNLRLYWGTSDQPANALLATFETHISYKDRAYIVAEDFLLGRERTNSPNWEFIARRAPRQSLVTGTAAALDANGQANLVAFAAELVTSPTGLGLPLNRFYAPSWQAVADAIDTTDLRSLLACSPLLTSREKVRTLFERFGEIAQIWARRRDSDGLIELGRWLPPEDLDTLPLITADDFTDDLEFDTTDMDMLPTEYTIEFTDGERMHKASSERVPDLAAGRLAVEAIAENISHPEITRRDQARRVVAEYMRQRRGGALQGTIQVRRSKGRPICPGDYFRLDIDTIPDGGGLAQLVRCLGRSFGPTGPIALEFCSEPASAPVPFAHAWVDAVPEELPAVPPLYYQRSISLPQAAGDAPTLTVLAARPADDVTGLEVLYDNDLGAGTY